MTLPCQALISYTVERATIQHSLKRRHHIQMLQLLAHNIFEHCSVDNSDKVYLDEDILVKQASTWRQPVAWNVCIRIKSIMCSCSYIVWLLEFSSDLLPVSLFASQTQINISVLLSSLYLKHLTTWKCHFASWNCNSSVPALSKSVCVWSFIPQPVFQLCIIHSSTE